MRYIFCLAFALFSFAAFTQRMDYADWVETRMGTDSKHSLSNGNTYPAVALPWGMNAWTPQTNRNGDGWMYQYGADKIQGIKQTHQPSPWINDYGQFSLMPVNKAVFTQADRASWYSHKTELAKPYAYEVYLADHRVRVAVSPTERAAVFSLNYQAGDSAYLVVDAFDKGSAIQIDPQARTISGYTTRNSGGVPANFKNYFVLQFDQPFTFKRVWHGSTLAGADTLAYEGDHAGALVAFASQQVEVKVASSFISLEQARLNLRREVGGKRYEQVRKEAKERWNQELGRVQVEDSNLTAMRTFYSCLYRLLLFPRKFYELNQLNEVVHYSPYNGQVLPGYLFTDNGFWDTFRAVFPFFAMMYPELDAQMMQGLENAYKESGWLPEWASPGHRDCMIGSNSASIITDAYIKGVRGFNAPLLYEAMLKSSGAEGPLGSVGRKGADWYWKLGFVPYDVGIAENVARTLEYGYADFCIAELGKALNRPAAEVEKYRKSSLAYQRVFDPDAKLMRGKTQAGIFQSPFLPFKWGDAFTEGNAWHYTWSVFHDPEGLKKLMGGAKGMEAMLDSVFVLPPVYDASYYGQVIHEITEMVIAGFGQYAHGNQPIQHMIYLYNYVGQPKKAQYWLREVMQRLYQPTPDGYCGDEDNGQTSAWYVFSSLGLYPLCPGKPEYVLGVPLFKKVILTLPNGKKWILEAPGISNTKRYVEKRMVNGRTHTGFLLTHAQWMEGGRMQCIMTDNPENH